MPKLRRPTTQTMEVNYELHSLGWKAFQNLCVTIAAEIWGQVVQSYFDSRDGGRDGAFHGTWKPSAGESYYGAFTAQCKFTAKANKALRLADLTDELTKAKRLAARGLADNYILFTNMRLTGKVDEGLKINSRLFRASSILWHLVASESLKLFWNLLVFACWFPVSMVLATLVKY